MFIHTNETRQEVGRIISLIHLKKPLKYSDLHIFGLNVHELITLNQISNSQYILFLYQQLRRTRCDTLLQRWMEQLPTVPQKKNLYIFFQI